VKKIYGLLGDVHHENSVITACLNAAFGDEIIITEKAEDIPWDDFDNQAALYISAKETNTSPLPDGTIEQWITPEREEALYRFVENGGAALFLHSGLVGFNIGSLYHELTGGVFIEHPPITAVTYVPVKRDHPIMKEIECFTGADEKYFCHINVSKVDVIMAGEDSVHAGNITGWCREIGKGRTVSLTPGHTFEIAQNPNMVKLLQNAANWGLKNE